jgi:hypothetical protein
MKYLKWKLSNGVWGTHPVEAITAAGGRAATSCYVNADGYRIGYAWGDIDLTALSADWDITEVTQAQAKNFAKNIWGDVDFANDGTLTSPEPSP